MDVDSAQSDIDSDTLILNPLNLTSSLITTSDAIRDVVNNLLHYLCQSESSKFQISQKGDGKGLCVELRQRSTKYNSEGAVEGFASEPAFGLVR